MANSTNFISQNFTPIGVKNNAEAYCTLASEILEKPVTNFASAIPELIAILSKEEYSSIKEDNLRKKVIKDLNHLQTVCNEAPKEGPAKATSHFISLRSSNGSTPSRSLQSHETQNFSKRRRITSPAPCISRNSPSPDTSDAASSSSIATPFRMSSTPLAMATPLSVTTPFPVTPQSLVIMTPFRDFNTDPTYATTTIESAIEQCNTLQKVVLEQNEAIKAFKHHVDTIKNSNKELEDEIAALQKKCSKLKNEKNYILDKCNCIQTKNANLEKKIKKQQLEIQKLKNPK